MKAELHVEGDKAALVATAAGAAFALLVAIWVNPIILLFTGGTTAGAWYAMRKINERKKTAKDEQKKEEEK